MISTNRPDGLRSAGRTAVKNPRTARPFETLERRVMLSGNVDDLLDLANGDHSSDLVADEIVQQQLQPINQTSHSTPPPVVGSPPVPVETNSTNDTSPPRSPSDFRYVLRPGNGWSGSTPQPPQQGTGVAADEKAIARWDVVPYQTVATELNVGVVAFHVNGIDHVRFSVNGGDWVQVREMKMNQDTGVYEYYATFRADQLPDGPAELRAVAYPNVGVPRVLEPLKLNANAGGSLPSVVRYVSRTGNDTTGNGTESNPYATIMRAARSIRDAQGNAEGGTIYLTAGDHVYGTYVYGWDFNTENRWLTITAAPGLDKSQVRLTGAGNVNGLSTRLVHIKNVTIASATITNWSGANGSLWIDDCSLVGPGRTVPTYWSGGWANHYITNSDISDASDGFVASIVRNVRINNIGSDAFSESGLVVNCEVSNINPAGTSFHPDVVQYYGVNSNLIVYGLVATDNILGQGLFPAPNGGQMRDIAFVNCLVDNTGSGGIVFQAIGQARHMLLKGCEFWGPSYWRTNKGFTAQNVVVEDTVFHNGISPSNVPGVTYR